MRDKSSRNLSIIFAVIVAVALCQLFRSWDASLLDRYEFRQLQTALSTYWIAHDGWQLAYPTPLFGPPWSIPMEFPTYQIITAALHNISGMRLEQTGRLVSILMLLACLPALHDLLSLVRLSHSRRLIVHALVLTAPVYLFYGRTFMIETTALSLSVWFLALLRRSLDRPSVWLMISCATIAVLAALTKVTTFAVFGLPAAVLCVGAWCKPNERTARTRISIAAVAPALFSLWFAWRWVRFSDGVKDSNPFSGFLTSRELAGWNFGSWSLRSDWSFWLHLQENVTSHNLAEGALAVALLCIPFATKRARWIAATAVLGFLSGPLVFANLYHLHDYYYAANALFLVSAAGLLLGSAWDNPRLPRGFNWLALAIMLVCQGYAYYRGYASHHRHPAPPAPKLAEIVKQHVPVDGVVLIYGADWNPLLPYYIERRVIMVPGERENETAVLEDVLARLPSASIDAMIVHGEKLRQRLDFIRDRVERFKLQPIPAASDDDDDVYLPGIAKTRAAMTVPPHQPWSFPTDLAETPLPEPAMKLFNPLPRITRSRYGLSAATLNDSPILNAHAPSEFVFTIPPHAREVNAVVGLPDAAFEPGHASISDGITVEIIHSTPHGHRVLAQRYLNPAANPSDRGPQEIQANLPTAPEGDLLLRIGSGRKNDSTQDWAYCRSLEIK